MTVLRSIDLLFLVGSLAMLVLLLRRRALENPTRFRVLLVGLLTFALQSLSHLFQEGPIAWGLRGLIVVTFPIFLVLVVRDTRALWRAEMERVKHL